MSGPDHDPLCPTDQNLPSIDHPCWFCALIARVRADERVRWGLGWAAAADNVQALAHAEAVAARLVEVVCRLDDELTEAQAFALLEDWNKNGWLDLPGKY